MTRIAQTIKKPSLTILSCLHHLSGIRLGINGPSVASKAIHTVTACPGRSSSSLSSQPNKHDSMYECRVTGADKAILGRAIHPKLAVDSQSRDYVVAKLEQDWLSEQFSGWLAKEMVVDKRLGGMR